MYYIIHNKHDKDSRAFVEAHGEGKMIIDFYDYSDPQTIMFNNSGIGISDFPSMVDIAKKIVSTKPADYDAGCKQIEGIDTANIKKTRNDQINHKTRMLIQSGITFNSQKISLRLENQSTLNMLFLQKANLTYPLEVKGFSDYISLADEADLVALYNQGSMAVLSILNGGYALKQSLDTMNYAQLLAFVDAR